MQASDGLHRRSLLWWWLPAPSQVLTVHTFFSVPAASFVSSPLLYPSPSPGGEASRSPREGLIVWLCWVTLRFGRFTGPFYPLTDSSWHVFWLGPFDNLSAFAFRSCSFKWHRNLCPSIGATVHNLQMSPLLQISPFNFWFHYFLYEGFCWVFLFHL